MRSHYTLHVFVEVYKMSYNILLVFSIIGFVSIFTVNGQRFGSGCQSNSECIQLISCQPMIDLLRSGSRKNQRLVRNAICGFKNRRSLVCCPNPEPVTTPKPTPFIIGNGGNNGQSLLPENCGRPSSEDRIIGGAPAPIGAYPWVVAMGYTEPGRDKPAFICSGSIINSKYVLTAAHCVDRSELGRKRLSVLHLGDWDLQTEEDCQINRFGTFCASKHIVAGYEDIVVHPQYNKRGRSSDDIALIRLNITLDFPNEEASVEPVCLPSGDLDVRSLVGDSRPVAAGWGLTEHGNSSTVLLRVDVPIVDDEKCRKRYNKDYVGNQICVGGEGGFDTCSGDSGGPLIFHPPLGPPFVQIGIVSFGPFPCGLQEFPGVYTDVKSYKSWIIQNLRP